MSKYTTGEIARLCGISVRTVQYYDERDLLVPSCLSEGGRRLYNDDDLRRLRIICFLRDAGLPINSISELLREDNTEDGITTLISEQENVLKKEISECEKKLGVLDGIRRSMKEIDNFSVESIGDIAHIMKNKKKLRKLRAIMLITGIPVTAFQWVSIILWITNGLWWLFPIWAAVAAIWGTWISIYYFRRVEYICPRCHTVFAPKFKEAFWANHTPTLRKLTCPECGIKGFCVETIREELNDNGTAD